ncbi:MAG: hypothetical protein A3F13_09895 [Gammaproteobacteria bacterium RIFCSPHIGHO2_12_FULL_40_19]|nr:MAG: hypothetical protein A3F13_09895 [Gammaproteobacteria bacterium RIFCSPHIGHO2_12_FULL_40_19]
MTATALNQNSQYPQFRWMLLLAMIYLTGWTTTYPMIYKMIEVHKILEPGAVFLFPLSYAMADIISEVYGYRVARQVVWFALFSGFIYCVAIAIVSSLPAPQFWNNQEHFSVVFSPILRAFFATTAASLIGNFINIYVISRWKVIMYGRYFWLRSLCSTAIGEATFSVIGGTLAYAGVLPWSKIVFLMLDGYLFKMLYALIAVWPAAMLVGLLKKAEGVDIYDRGISYNPFKLNINN